MGISDMELGIDQIVLYYGLPGLSAVLSAAGFVLALVYWRRCPSACQWVALACAIHFVVTCARVVFLTISFQIVNDRETINFIFIGMGFLNLVAYAMLLLAAFAGRNQPTRPYPPLTPRSRYDDDWDPPPKKSPPPAGSDDVGIRE